VPVALVAELPVELVDQAGQARRGRPGHGTRGGQLDADQLQLAEQGVVVLLERQVGLDRDADEVDGAEPRAGGCDAVGGHAGLLLWRRGGRGALAGGGRGALAGEVELGPDHLAVARRLDAPGLAEHGDHAEAPAGGRVRLVVAQGDRRRRLVLDADPDTGSGPG
jgi:hypothetical protein